MESLTQKLLSVQNTDVSVRYGPQAGRRTRIPPWTEMEGRRGEGMEMEGRIAGTPADQQIRDTKAKGTATENFCETRNQGVAGRSGAGRGGVCARAGPELGGESI